MPKEIEGIVIYNLEELRDILEVSVITLGKYIRSGKLKGRKIGRRWYVSRDNLKRFLEGNNGENSKQNKGKNTAKKRR